MGFNKLIGTAIQCKEYSRTQIRHKLADSNSKPLNGLSPHSKLCCSILKFSCLPRDSIIVDLLTVLMSRLSTLCNICLSHLVHWFSKSWSNRPFSLLFTLGWLGSIFITESTHKNYFTSNSHEINSRHNQQQIVTQ